MKEVTQNKQALLILSAFSSRLEALEWASSHTQALWGSIALESDFINFKDTSHCKPILTSDLKLKIFAFTNLIQPETLPGIKTKTTELEALYGFEQNIEQSRLINLNPGYLMPSKIVLATTKDASHRLYLGKNIYGEVTLAHSDNQWQHFPWTPPNYCQPECIDFLTRCREYHTVNM